jgi:hypothetical protein
MKSLQVSIPVQDNMIASLNTQSNVSNLEIISLLLLLFLGMPLIATLFKQHNIRHERQIKAQHAMLERIWKARSGKPQR